jgi:hypothetical protein
MGKANRRYLDVLLLAGWVYSYAFLLFVFRIVKRIESDSGTSDVRERSGASGNRQDD